MKLKIIMILIEICLYNNEEEMIKFFGIDIEFFLKKRNVEIW